MTISPPPTYTVMVKAEDMKVAMRLAGDGTLTNRKVHAAIFGTRDYAQEVADRIEANNPDVTATVKPF